MTALHWFVETARMAGLNYGFLLEAYERDAFVRGLGVTLQLCLLVIPGSLLCGLVLAPALRAPQRWLSGAARACVEFTRNTPTLVQLYCAFLVFNMLITRAFETHGEPNPLTPVFWVFVVVSIHKGVFHAEALRAGIEAVPPVTLEAARSLGLSQRQIFLQIELPIALRFALPSLINNMVDLVKMTAIASAIAVGDVTYESIMIWTHRDNVLELILLILLYFWLLTWCVSAIGRQLETRLRMPGYGQ